MIRYWKNYRRYEGVTIRPFYVKTQTKSLTKITRFEDVALNSLSNMFVLSKDGAECLVRLEVEDMPSEERDDAIFNEIISNKPMLMTYMRYLLDEDFYDSVSFEELIINGKGAGEGSEGYGFTVEPDVYEKMLKAAADYPERFDSMYEVVERLDDNKIGEEFKQLLELFMKAAGRKGKAVIKDAMRRIASEHKLSQGNMGAKQLLSLLDYMDDSILGYEDAEVPERVPSDDDIDTLVNIAIGSPAVCLYRDLEEIVDLEERKEIARDCCDKSFVSMFNRPESRSIMDAVFEGKKGSSDEKHYEQVFHYCVDGNFQSMLDEYKFALGVSGEEFVEAIKDAFLQTTTLPYVSQEYYKASFTDRPQSKAPRLRVHFAAGYFDARYSY